MARRDNLFHLADALADVTDDMQPATALARVQSAWPESAGPTLAKWATPVSERAGIVTLECTDSMVAHELEMMKPELLRKLSQQLPEGAPKDLRFVVR